MLRSIQSRLSVLTALVLAAPAIAGQVAAPAFDPDGGTAPAPLKVTIRCATPDAAIHITLDGDEPTERDTEIESGATIALDQPLTLKAKAFLADGSASAVKSAKYLLTPVPGNGASFIEQSVPETMGAGQSYKVTVVLRNIGTIPWTPDAMLLVPRREKNATAWSVVQVALREPVATWKTAAFTFRITAPTQPGTYNFQWQMQAAGGARFGEVTPVVRVLVVPPEELSNATKSGALSTETRAGDAAAKSTNKPAPLPDAIAKLAAAHQVIAGSDLDRIIRALLRSPHSFKALRERGFTQSDAEFERIIAKNPGLFRSTRIIRRDEKGQRIIPGWPAIDLRGR